MKILSVLVAAMAIFSSVAFADDFDKTGVNFSAQGEKFSFGVSEGASRDFNDEDTVFSVSYNQLPVVLGLQYTDNGNINNYRFNISKRSEVEIINVTFYGVAEAHYDFGDSFNEDRLVLSPYVGVQFGTAGSKFLPYVEVGYDVDSNEGDFLDLKKKDSYAQLGAKLAMSDNVELDAAVLQKMDTDFDSVDRELLVSLVYKF